MKNEKQWCSGQMYHAFVSDVFPAKIDEPAM
jgi:hypothetical protein